MTGQLLDGLRDFLGNKQLSFSISYSGKFKPYNALVRKSGSLLEFSLSSEWCSVSNEIVLGLLESLSSRIMHIKGRNSVNIDLYNNFVRSIHVAFPKTERDLVLELCFNRVNEEYFNGLVEKPNLVWHSSLKRLASYDYHTDTVSVSDVFKGRHDVIEYLMYHELLHKKLKFTEGNGRTVHHGGLFRRKEKEFTDSELLEREISRIIRGRKTLSFASRKSRRFWE